MVQIMEFLQNLLNEYGGLAGLTVVAIGTIAATAKLAIEHFSSQELEHFKSALSRMERLEASRGTGYGAIWILTGSLNLFGPTSRISCAKSEKLSSSLTEWYFEHGWVLSPESKNRYFLVQETLNFGFLKSISYNRPPDADLYDSADRTLDALWRLRCTSLEIEKPKNKKEYSDVELQGYVKKWKSQFSRSNQEPVSAETNWLMLQFVLSAFRTHMIKEIREGVTPNKEE